jgi:hypothetical protein
MQLRGKDESGSKRGRVAMKPYIMVDGTGWVTVSDGSDYQSMTLETLYKKLLFMDRLQFIMVHDPLRLQNDPFGVIADINCEELIGERDEF